MKAKGKKILSSILSATLLLSTASPLTVLSTAVDSDDDAPGIISTKDSVMRGDADMNGKITANDAREMASAHIGKIEFDDDQMNACDLDSDGMISLMEARSVLRYAAKLTTDTDASLNDVPELDEDAQEPTLEFYSIYDNENDIYTLEIDASNVKNHLTLGGSLILPDGVEVDSFEEGDGSLISDATYISEMNTINFCAVSVKEFTDDVITVATVKLKVDSDIASSESIAYPTLQTDNEDETYLDGVTLYDLIGLYDHGDYVEESYDYEENDDGTVTVTGFTPREDSTGTLFIPSEIDGHTVTGFMAYLSGNYSEVVIPDTISLYLYNFFFEDLSNLSCITVDENNENYSSADGVLFNKDGSELIAYPVGKEDSEYTVPDSVDKILDSAFNGNSYLESVTIPDGVTEIESAAFINCENLSQIFLPDTLAKLGNAVFRNTAYSNNGDNWEDGYLYIGNCLVDFDNEIETTEITVKDGTVLIADGLFDCYLSDFFPTSITLPDTLKYIGEFAFRSCTQIEELTIPESVESIGRMAFYDCTLIKSVTIPKNVTEIGEYALGFSEEYNDMDEPTKIDGFTVYGYTDSAAQKYAEDNGFEFVQLDDSDLPETEEYEYYEDENGNIVITDFTPAADSTGALTIPAEIDDKYVTEFYATLLGDYEEVILPTTISEISPNVFGFLESLNKISVDENSPYFSSADGVLFNKDKTELIKYPVAKSETEYTVPDSVNIISSDAFENNCILESLTIPDSVTTIIGYAFAYCGNLSKISISKNLTKIGASVFYGGAYYNNEDNWTDGCLYLDNYLICCADDFDSDTLSVKDGTVLIADDIIPSIDISDKITDIILPDTLKYIGDYAFSNCKNLEDASLPESIESIGIYAFCNCPLINSVTIPKNVTEIGEYAFGYKNEYNDETYMNETTKIEGFIISGYAGTVAETYAKDNGFEFEDIVEVIMGDADGNGKVNSQDARLMARMACGMILPTADQMKICDFDNDGKISLIEARCALRFAAKLIANINDSINDEPELEKDAPTPDLIMDAKYDDSQSELTLTVSATGIKNHFTAKGLIDIPAGLKYVSSEAIEGKFVSESGVTTDNSKVAFYAMSTTAFDSDTIDLATIKFSVDREVISNSVNIGLSYYVDEKEEKYTSVSVSVATAVTPGDDEEIDSNFLYSRFYFDENKNSAVYNIQLCNFQDVSEFPSGKITVKYPTDILKYNKFASGDLEGLGVTVEQVSDGVLVIDYTAKKSVAAADYTLVDLYFDVITETGFGYATIKSADPTYMTDKNGKQINFTLENSEFICSHKYMDSLADEEATCSLSGHHGGKVCRMCGYTEGEEFIAPKGHTFKDGKCTVCGSLDTPTVLFNSKWYSESNILDVNIKLDNSLDSCGYDFYIEYPSDKLKIHDFTWYIDGKTNFVDNLSAHCYTDKINGKDYLVINVRTDTGWISDYAKDISFNFKFYYPDRKDGDSLTFSMKRDVPDTNNRLFKGIDYILILPDAEFVIDASQFVSTLELKSDSAVKLDNENKTVTCVPATVKGMTVAELKAQFKSAINLSLDDSALVPNGTKFTYNGKEYTVIIKGDVSADGKISAADARMILRISAKLESPDELTKAAADINSDGKVTSSEARDALRFSAKLTSSLTTDSNVKLPKIKKAG